MDLVDVAQPELRVPFINNSTILIPEHGVIAAINFSNTGRDATLFLIDVKTLKEVRHPLPSGEQSAYGFVKGCDGNLYIGTFSGALLRYDFRDRTLAKIATPFKKGELVWGGGASKSGKIYMGVCPTGRVCEYDIATETLKVFDTLPLKADIAYYARGFIELPDGRMLIAVTGGDPTLFTFDSANSKLEKVLSPPLPEAVHIRFHCFYDDDRLIVGLKNSTSCFNWRTNTLESDTIPNLPSDAFAGIAQNNGEFYGSSLKSSTIYRLFGDSWKKVMNGLPKGNRISEFHALGADEFIGLGDNGFCAKFTINGEIISSTQVENQSNNGMSINTLRYSSEQNTAIGSHFINAQIFAIDLATKSTKSSLEKITGLPGQITCVDYLNGTWYLGFYSKAALFSYNASEPFVFSENPREVCRLGNNQNRPCGLVNDGELLYMASKPDYGMLGGAIAVINPETEKVEVYSDFVKNQSPTSLFYDEKTSCLVGATQIFGDMNSHIPKALGAVVFMWDVKAKKTIHTSCPGENVDSLRTLALSKAGVLIGFDDDSYFLFSTTERKYSIKSWDSGFVTGGIFVRNNIFLGATNDKVFLLDIDANELTILGETTGTHLFTQISHNEVLIDFDKSYVKKLTLDLD